LINLTLLDIYKAKLKLHPAEVQFLMGFIAIPWSLKILYGFSSDHISIFSARRRNHIVLNALLNISFMGLAIKYGTELGKFFITICVFISQMNMAYCDTVTDALSL